jgi:hypothetical protein
MYLWLGKSNICAYMKPDGCPLAIASGIFFVVEGNRLWNLCRHNQKDFAETMLEWNIQIDSYCSQKLHLQ